MGKFSDGIRKSVEDVKQQINSKIIEIAQYAFRSAVGYSPTAPEARWAKGEFINSWYPAENSYSSSITGSYDYSGAGSMARIAALSSSQVFFGKDGFISLSNNLSYSLQVEYTGWQRTGPYAPVRNAIVSVMSTYSK